MRTTWEARSSRCFVQTDIGVRWLYFVAKGSVEAFVPKLKHEGRVYRHLLGSQGELVPVYLGNISLANAYFLDFGVRIVHMLLMSWAGEWAQKDLISRIGRDLDLETARAAAALRDRGVEHCDVRPPNVLWDTENSRVMLVDFERSTILKRASILHEVSPNRKRKHQDAKGETFDDTFSRRALILRNSQLANVS